MTFYKMQALGNDFVIFGSPALTTLPKSSLIKLICDRHYGVGSDCAVCISASANYDFSMHVFNPDGFEAEICGNALRCSAQYVTERGFFKKRDYYAETLVGPRKLSVKSRNITAEIGKPIVKDTGVLDICGYALPYTEVSLGNPHCVIFTSSIKDDEFQVLGKAIETHPIFPCGTNVEFAIVTENNKIAMRVWERGIGETLSCVTGSCACVAAANNAGYGFKQASVYQKGGVIDIYSDENDTMFVEGGCTTVFKGELLKNN